MGTTRAVVKVVGGSIACVLAASLICAASAGARSQGFNVYNLTGEPMKLKEIQLENDAAFEAAGPTSPPHPRVGDILMPGIDTGRNYNHNHIELDRRLVAPFGVGRLFYTNGTRDYGAMLHTGFRRPYCEWFSPAPYCTTDPPAIYFLDEPGTDREFGGGDPQKHAELVQRICTNANLRSDDLTITCDFDPRERDPKAFGSPHSVGLTVPNCSVPTNDPAEDRENTIDVDLEEEDKTGAENSFGIKLGIEAGFDYLGAHVKTSLEEEYKGKWTSEHTFKKSISYKVKPGLIGWVVAENPVIRVTGDMTLKIGNTTQHLRDVYFDYPDPSRDGQVQWRPVRTEMTAEQRKQICKEGEQSPARAPASNAQVKQKGTAGANTMYGGAESTTLLGRGGHDILLGDAGNDRLSGGPGRDLIMGGRGSDTIVDARGRTRVLTGTSGKAGPDIVDVRDGEGRDRVICGKRRAIVRADPGDRVRSCRR
jgi:hypothetical protein